MFFRRSQPSPPRDAASTATASTSAADVVTPVLDTLGQLLSAYAYGLFHMPDRPEAESRALFDAWRRHAMIGTPAPTDDAPPEWTPSNGKAADADEADGPAPKHGAIVDRDWPGVARTFTEHRRAEKVFVESALSDLRDALWVCIERTHDALQTDHEAAAAMGTQITRLRGALDRLETSVVRNEMAQAMQALEDIQARRQAAQAAIYGQMAARVEQLGSQLVEAQRTSETDPLTHLGNRLAFDHAVARQVPLHAMSRQPLALIIADLDGLKPINDSLGHQGGDAALVAMANALHRVFLRESDVVCRIGGDEFAIVLANTSLPLTEKLMARLDQALRTTPWTFSDAGYTLSASMGAAVWEPGEAPSTWIERADAAMYAQKRERHA